MRQFLSLKTIISATLLLSTVTLFAGCSWVEPLPGVKEIRVVSKDQVSQCKQLGRTHVQTAHEIGFIPRGYAAMREDLVALAKNDAKRMQGNRLVAIDEIKKGQQSYAIYRCP